MTARYAIYFAPAPGTRWWDFGCAWLGYDALSGAPVPQSRIPGVPAATFAALTAEPRRYGFHGTLKAPMRLAPGFGEADLVAALEAFVARRAAFTLPRLQVERLRHFIALTPAAHAPQLHALADDCVRDFDRFRAPPAAAELARRRRTALGPEEETLLERWGYPYVFGAFRFHLTLTASVEGVPAEIVRAIADAAAQALAGLADEPLACDALCLFVQPDPQSSFRMTRRLPFPG